MKHQLEKEYHYLWDGSEPGWVLLREPMLPGGFCAYHADNRTLLHIENDDVNAAVCLRMKQEGVEIIDAIPPGEVQVRPIED